MAKKVSVRDAFAWAKTSKKSKIWVLLQLLPRTQQKTNVPDMGQKNLPSEFIILLSKLVSAFAYEIREFAHETSFLCMLRKRVLTKQVLTQRALTKRVFTRQLFYYCSRNECSRSEFQLPNSKHCLRILRTNILSGGRNIRYSIKEGETLES